MLSPGPPPALTLCLLRRRAGYQYYLSNGLAEYILHADRTSFVSQNREGLCGIAGFLSIFLFGVSVGRHIFVKTQLPLPAAVRVKNTPNRPRARSIGEELAQATTPTSSAAPSAPAAGPLAGSMSLYLQLLSGAMACWLLTLYAQGHVEPASRRMVNLSFITWVVAFNVTQVRACAIRWLGCKRVRSLCAWPRGHQRRLLIHVYRFYIPVYHHSCAYFCWVSSSLCRLAPNQDALAQAIAPRSL